MNRLIDVQFLHTLARETLQDCYSLLVNISFEIWEGQKEKQYKTKQKKQKTKNKKKNTPTKQTKKQNRKLFLAVDIMRNAPNIENNLKFNLNFFNLTESRWNTTYLMIDRLILKVCQPVWNYLMHRG